MNDRASLLQRLIRLLRGTGADRSRPERSPAGSHTGSARGCGEAPTVTCEEALSRVYEFLDGELSKREMRSIRCHLEQCRRCYPMYDWEKLFLDTVSEYGSRPEAHDDLRRRLRELLGRDPPA